ncbi:MAG: hypothetical protein JWP12_2785 [Bacteroidetes bacterium]|nr:hypothetical protein [Bacteroidota bacterium]
MILLFKSLIGLIWSYIVKITILVNKQTINLDLFPGNKTLYWLVQSIVRRIYG